MTAHESLVQLAASLVEEIAAGRAAELAQPSGGSVGSGSQATAPAAPAPTPPRPRRGAGAVHPQLGWHLVVMPGDTISQQAYAHITSPQAGPPARRAIETPGVPAPGTP